MPNDPTERRVVVTGVPRRTRRGTGHHRPRTEIDEQIAGGVGESLGPAQVVREPGPKIWFQVLMQSLQLGPRRRARRIHRFTHRFLISLEAVPRRSLLRRRPASLGHVTKVRQT